MSKAKQWIIGAMLVALASLAHARIDMPHGGFHGGGGGGGHFGSFPAGMRGNPRGFGGFAQGGGGHARGDRAVNVMQGRNAPMQAGTPPGYRGGPQMAPRAPSPSPLQQYAGGITPVSAEARPVPRPANNPAMIRSGSIREDVARYNEERGFGRPVPRPPDEGSRPGPLPYHN